MPHERDLNDYILVFPADAGMEPIYVYLSEGKDRVSVIDDVVDNNSLKLNEKVEQLRLEKKEANGTLTKASSANTIQNPSETQISVDKKLSAYLLEKNHPVGGTKAEWFDSALGFNKENSSALAKQIVFNPQQAVKTGDTQFGTKYDQVISITGANGKVIDVKFGWIKNNDGVVRLVTSIPTKK